jgi:hypothetical protein
MALRAMTIACGGGRWVYWPGRHDKRQVAALAGSVVLLTGSADLLPESTVTATVDWHDPPVA